VLRTKHLRDAAAKVAPRTLSNVLTIIGVAALAVAVGMAMPAEAKKRHEKPVQPPIADPANGEPMTLVVSLNNQRVEIFRGTTLVTSSKVSTGMRGYATKAGVFSILEKKRMHHSNLYSGAPMPYMQRLTWSGTALHAGIVPGYPASHGCIRLPFSFAPKLFGVTTVGENVVVARDSVAPQIIEHPNLFQPLPPPEAPAIVKQDHPPQRQSSLATPLPVILANADVGGVTIDRTPIPATAFQVNTPAQPRTRVAAASSQVKAAGMIPTGDAAADPTEMDAQVEDTHVHAIDPFAGAAAQASKQGGGEAASSAGHALDEEEGDAPSTDVAIERTPAPKPETAAAKAETPTVEKPVTETAKPAPVLPVVAEISPAPSSAPIEAKAEVAAPAPAAQAAVTPATAPLPSEAKPEPVESAVAEATPAVPAPAAIEPVSPAVSLAQPGQAIDADAALSVIATKLGAGTKAAAIQAAEPRSTAPLRILVTRRNKKDRIISLQQVLTDMGYLEGQEFDGTIGKASVAAFKTFQRNNGLPETGAVSEELISKVYEVAGKGQPPIGHLFVRQGFGKVFDAPVNFRDPETPLGTHLFTAMKFEPGATKTRWMSVSLQGDDPAAALDRLEISSDIRQKISERLTSGSSLIIGDLAINSGGLPKGADFVVWAKDTPAKITAASLDGYISEPRAKKKKKRSVRRPNYNYGLGVPRTFSRGYNSWPF
jgi:peptidoglycan hydrolase-like protein with peptidoglycan-binding domain